MGEQQEADAEESNHDRDRHDPEGTEVEEDTNRRW
jgi:hypothetical protein